eukprot:CAMPEP_0177609724 /NCGR_PEP_ID=MMETSP0419_2-20121207/19290_1 /TAXON_ID=582737 /ORGANISM="Tetraselmis sp., Strain GSL018" /LENGTH=289 /DNA_ID=CAMNT_0019104765 /DNA_START=1312 /DNA_END=2181 /DNA_ORIENTATION=-
MPAAITGGSTLPSSVSNSQDVIQGELPGIPSLFPEDHTSEWELGNAVTETRPTTAERLPLQLLFPGAEAGNAVQSSAPSFTDWTAAEALGLVPLQTLRGGPAPQPDSFAAGAPVESSADPFLTVGASTAGIFLSSPQGSAGLLGSSGQSRCWAPPDQTGLRLAVPAESIAAAVESAGLPASAKPPINPPSLEALGGASMPPPPPRQPQAEAGRKRGRGAAAELEEELHALGAEGRELARRIVEVSAEVGRMQKHEAELLAVHRLLHEQLAALEQGSPGSGPAESPARSD